MSPLVKAAKPLVGLIGRKRSGKDTFAAVLIQEAGFTSAGFADPLREAALAINPIIDYRVGRSLLPEAVRYADVIRDRGYEQGKDIFPEVRGFLQRLGTEGGRDIHGPNVWVDLAAKRIDARATPLVLTDVRFPNEAEAITSRGGYLIRIARPGQVDDGDIHPSETALDDYAVKFTIYNDGTLEDFRAQARALAKYLVGLEPRSA